MSSPNRLLDRHGLFVGALPLESAATAGDYGPLDLVCLGHDPIELLVLDRVESDALLRICVTWATAKR